MSEQFTLTWSITEKDEGVLVREFLKKHHISKTALTDIKFNGGDILVNGGHVTVRYSLKQGDMLSVLFPPEIPSEGLTGENIPLEIVYEDDYILVINKPPFLSSIPSREHPTGSMSHALLYYYEQQGIASTIHLVNRLDRDTSGLLIVAKYRYVHYLFSKEQQRHTIQRTYRAIVHGTLAFDKGTVDAPIGRKSESIIEREVREDGQHAVTHYKVLQRSEDFTYVALKLETGRTHQIRVHMSYLGHPLLGDELYGGKRDKIERQALHSHELHFYHPILQKEFFFTAEVPGDMKKIIE
ncbi:RluA family pseudouridine synthase [Bacillus songklensis]|uniref:Pseudouridine synthase n=1 Tax=Bacillus songklensis TaxID=1069116 RepID=A0ABV8B5E4_9BACI